MALVASKFEGAAGGLVGIFPPNYCFFSGFSAGFSVIPDISRKDVPVRLQNIVVVTGGGRHRPRTSRSPMPARAPMS